jgi:regulator of nonsense transcripts 3
MVNYNYNSLKPDPDYLEFLKLIAKPARNLPCAEIQDAEESGQ